MKLNFIQNLSNQIVKENHQLKAQVSQLTHKLKDYEQQLITVITAIDPSLTVHDSPEQMMEQFMNGIQTQRLTFEHLKINHEKLAHLSEQLKQKNMRAAKELEKVTAIEQQNKTRLLTQSQRLMDELTHSKQEIDTLNKANNDIKQQFNQLKIQKLRQSELNRQEIEQINLQHHVQVISLKIKIEKGHMKVEKLLREELDSKNKAIKEMSKVITEMKSFQNVGEKNVTFIEQMFKKLQKYSDLSETIKEVRAENSELREQKQQLQNAKATLQVKMKESKLTEYNLLSQIERTMIYLQDLESKLLIKTNDLLKSQKDKQQMQNYYGERWNSEYKRVKNQLGKDYIKRIEDIQENYTTKVNSMQVSMNQVLEIRNKLLLRNSFLEQIYDKDQADKQQLSQNIKQLKGEIQELNVIIREVDCMNHENLLVLENRWKNQRQSFKQNIDQFHQKLKIQKQSMQKANIQQIQKIEYLHKLYKDKLKQQQNLFNSQKKKIQASYESELNKVEQLIANQTENFSQRQILFEKEYEKRLAIKVQQFEETLKHKDQECELQNQKWIDRLRQTEAFNSLVRKKLEEESNSFKQQAQVLQGKNEQLRRTLDQLLEKIEQQKKENNTLKERVNSLEWTMLERNRSIATLQQKIQKVQRWLQQSKKQVDVLFMMRNDWQKELTDLQFDYRHQFDNIKKEAEKQKQLLRFKLAELQDMNKRRMVNRKEYEQIQLLNEQKDTLKEQMHVREAENIILTQIKSYYETKLKEAEKQIGKCELTNTQTVFARKMKKSKFRPQQECSSQRIFEPPKPSEQMNDIKRYALNSYQRHYNLSLSKAKLEENTSRQFRFKTSYGP